MEKLKMGSLTWSIIHFKDLSLQQLFDLYKLRTEVFVVEQDCPYPEVDDIDPRSYHVLAYSNNDLLAVARIIPKELNYKEYSFGRVAISKKYRGRGIAHLLTERMMSFIKKRFDSPSVRISAQSYLLGFYKKHGFEIASEEYLEDGIPHTEMLYLPQ